MNGEKQVRCTLVFIAWLMVFVFVSPFPGISFGQQPVLQKTQIKAVNPVLLRAVKPVAQERKVAVPSRAVVRQPAKVDLRKLEQIKVVPGNFRIPQDTRPLEQRLPHNGPELGSQEGLEGQGTTYYPYSRQTHNPLAAGSDPGLGGPTDPQPRCFIATAAYGSPFAEDISVLKKFRDEQLLTNNIGKWFVAFYYENSPPIANYIADRDKLRLFTRAALWPLVFALKHTMITAVLLLIVLIVVSAYTRSNRSYHGKV